jgi:hypothetical protein
MIFLWLFDLRVSTYLVLGGLVSFFTATMIYVIAILDTRLHGRNRRVARAVAAGQPPDEG